MKLKNLYYIRLLVDNESGVLSQIASAFAENNISIKAVIQKSRVKDTAELVIVTENTTRESILQVEKSLKILPCMRQVANMIRVMDDKNV